MKLDTLVKASETLEKLEGIERKMDRDGKVLSEDGLNMIEEIIEKSITELSAADNRNDPGMREFLRIQTLIFDQASKIVRKAESNLVLSMI